MKQFLILSMIIATAFAADAQDSWKVKLNSKVLMSATAESETKNTKKIKRAELAKNGFLEILYKEITPREGWKRSILLFDENDNEVYRVDSTSSNTKITSKNLHKLFTGKKKLRIYTVSLPTDPNMAASVRVRRIHLATLELQ